MPHCKDIVICNIYRPPYGKLDKTVKYLENCLSSINSSKTDIFLTGDFNVDYSNKKTADYRGISFFVKSNQLLQLINESTRITKKTRTTLDLIITNCKYVHKAGSLDTFLSDHKPVYVTKKKQRDIRHKETFVGRSYRHFNEKEFKDALSGKNWNDILNKTSAERAWQSLMHEIEAETDRICPYKKFTVRAQKPEWLNNNLIEQMKDRDYFYRKAKKSQNEDDWNIAKYLRNTVNFNIRQAKADFIKDELNSSKNDPKKFWRVINRVFPGKNKLRSNKILLKNNQNRLVKDQSVPDFINDFFIHIGQKIAERNSNSNANVSAPNNRQQQRPPHYTRDDFFEIQAVKEVDVSKEIESIDIKKSSGFSHINSRVLKEAFKALIPELTIVFNISIQSESFPDSWKSATVIPIPKSGDLCKVENYIPISLLPLPGKLLEKVVHTQLEAELEKSDTFTKYQHGFRKNRSTTHAVLQLINQINQKMDKNIPTIAVFIDFKKAFDCVDHDILLDKLCTTNLGPSTINWLKDYLANRQQHVIANNLESTTLTIKQGVPQGSTLGPLLYILYANNIPENIKGQVSLYADNTVVFHSSKNKAKTEKSLQEDMDNLKHWCHMNKLTINTDKTKIMIFGQRKSREKFGTISINYEGKLIDEVTHYNYLGVKLDQMLKHDLHAKAIIQRVSDKLRYLKRIRRFITATAALSIYKNMILPILEYGNVLLVSITVILRKKLQTLQNKALKCALGLDPTTSSKEVHKLAKIDNLKVRREMQLSQIMFKQKDDPFLWRRKKKRSSGVTTRSALKKLFVITQAKTEKFKKSITNKAPALWNSLPRDIQVAQDLRLFKHLVRKHLTKYPTKA